MPNKREVEAEVSSDQRPGRYGDFWFVTFFDTVTANPKASAILGLNLLERCGLRAPAKGDRLRITLIPADKNEKYTIVSVAHIDQPQPTASEHTLKSRGDEGSSKSSESPPKNARKNQSEGADQTECGGEFTITGAPTGELTYLFARFTTDAGQNFTATVSSTIVRAAGYRPDSVIPNASKTSEHQDSSGEHHYQGKVRKNTSGRWNIFWMNGVPAYLNAALTKVLARVPPRFSTQEIESVEDDYILSLVSTMGNLDVQVSAKTFHYVGIGALGIGAELVLDWERKGLFWSIARIPRSTLLGMFECEEKGAPRETGGLEARYTEVRARSHGQALEFWTSASSPQTKVPLLFSTSNSQITLKGEVKSTILKERGLTVIDPSQMTVFCILTLVDEQWRVEQVLSLKKQPKYIPHIEKKLYQIDLFFPVQHEILANEDSALSEGAIDQKLQRLKLEPLDDRVQFPCYIHEERLEDLAERAQGVVLNCDITLRFRKSFEDLVKEFYVSKIHRVSL